MTPDIAIINGLLQVREGDERGMDHYIGGLMMQFSKPFVDVADDQIVHFCLLEDDVREIIKTLLKENLRHIDNKILESI